MHPEAERSELLTIPEAASLLRLRPSTLRAWRQQARIPVVKLGGRVFIRKSDAEALIARSVVPARTEDSKGTKQPLTGSGSGGKAVRHEQT
jgi:excisionase family DNA binding protein